MLDQVKQYIWSYDACAYEASRSPWRHFLQIAFMVGRDLLGGMITLRAMGLVYTTLLSMVPLLAVSISVLKGFGVHNQLEPTLVRLLAPLGEQSVELAGRIVGFVENLEIGVLGAMGLVLLIYTAISLVQKIESAFNHTWRLQANRSLTQRFSDYLSVVMVGPVLIFSAVGITASLGNNHLAELLGTLPYLNKLLGLLGDILPLLLIVIAFTFIYLVVPNTRVKFNSALYGALIAGLLWEACGSLFASFVGGSSSYTAIYSGFAIVLIFMIWIYLAWIILLLGASISFYHQHPQQLNWQKQDVHLSGRMRDQLALQAMVTIARAHDGQIDLQPTLENLAADQQVPLDVLQRMLSALQYDRLVELSVHKPPCYLPARSLQRIKLSEVLRSARAAEDQGQTDNFRSDACVLELLQQASQSLDTHLGEVTLRDFLQSTEDQESNEDSLV